MNGRLWAFAPVVLLGGLVATVLGFVHVAMTDPSFAVEDRYYARALSWDEHLAAERRSAELGWHATLRTARLPGGAIGLELALVDRAGAPVRGARVELEAFAVARSRRALRATLREQPGGEYRAELPADRGGRWEFAFDALRGGERFTVSLRSDVPG